jgi:hypothetical protein
MHENISTALITAFEQHYDTRWDDAQLRNERLAWRAAWDAARAATAAVAGTTLVSIPHELLVRAVNSLGAFVSEHGWAQTDMDTLDALCAAMPAADLAAAHSLSAAAPALEAPAAPTVPPGFALVPLRLTRAMNEAISEEGWQWEDLLAAAQAVTEEQYEASAQDRLSRDEVRAIFLECGFVIKEGQTDLKPYVYEAAQVLESRVRSIAAAAPQAPAAPSAEGLREQHDRDSAELRRLCQARDEARRERDLARAEIAGLQSSTVHLSALVDGQHALLEKAKATMTALHGSASPIDESGGDFDARIPASAFARFVDAHAELLHAMAQSPVAAPAAPAVDASDTALLDGMERHRIAVVPEFEGPWDAELYEGGEEPQHIGSGATPREALRAALAAQAKEGGAESAWRQKRLGDVEAAGRELKRLHAENERLLTQVHKLEMDVLDLASENSILKRPEA